MKDPMDSTGQLLPLTCQNIEITTKNQNLRKFDTEGGANTFEIRPQRCQAVMGTNSFFTIKL